MKGSTSPLRAGHFRKKAEKKELRDTRAYNPGLITKWLPLISPCKPEKAVIFAPTVIFCRLVLWFLGGGPQGGVLGKITVFSHQHTRLTARQLDQKVSRPVQGALQITFKSNRMMTIRMIKLIPPPP
jgi:hypothetical protein